MYVSGRRIYPSARAVACRDEEGPAEKQRHDYDPDERNGGSPSHCRVLVATGLVADALLSKTGFPSRIAHTAGTD